MSKLMAERAALEGESFKTLMEKRVPFFQQVQSHKEARFQLSSFLSKSQGSPVAGEESAGSSPSLEAESEDTRAEQGRKTPAIDPLATIEEIIAEARQESLKIKEDAYQEGLTQGLAQGRDKGQTEGRKEVRGKLLPLEDIFRNLIKQVEQAQEDILIKQEREILHLCIKMAQKIIHTEISQNPDLILANLREGLKSVGYRKVAAIRLNPRDLELIQNAREEISQSILNLEGVTLEGDPGLLAGGCLIQTDLGHVDATIETQLQELEKTLVADGGENR